MPPAPHTPRITSDAPASAYKRRRRRRNCARGLSGRVRRCRGCRSAAGRLGQGRLRFFQFRGVVFITVGPHTKPHTLSHSHTLVRADVLHRSTRARALSLSLSFSLALAFSLSLSFSLSHAGPAALRGLHPHARSSIAGLHFLAAPSARASIASSLQGPAQGFVTLFGAQHAP